MNEQKTDEGKQKTHQATSKRQNNNILQQFTKNGKLNAHIKQESNIVSILVQHFFISLNIIHTILTEIITSNSQNLSINQIYHFSDYLKIYRITYIVIMGLKIILILSLYLEIIYQNKEIALVSWASKNIIKSFGVLKEIDLSFTAFLCLLSLKENLFPLLLSAAIYIIYTINLQNYVVRKEVAYCSSIINSCAFRFFIVGNYFLNILFANIHNKTVFSSYYGCLAIIFFIWYIRNGHRLYHYSTLRQIYLILMAAFITIYLKLLQNLFYNTVSIVTTEIAKLILVFSFVIFNFWIFLNKFNYNYQNKHIKQFDIYLNILLEDSFKNANSNAQLLGLLNYHKEQVVNQQNFYDPFLKTSIGKKDYYYQKESIVRNFIKKKYQRLIADYSHQQNCQNCLEYCQYLCNYDPNYFQIQKCIQRIDSHSLTVFQRVRLNHMKSIVKESNAQIGRQLYFSKLSIQAIIQSQKCFIQIQNDVLKYIQSNIDTWQMMQHQEISIAQFRKYLKTSFELKEAIGDRWKNISNFISLNTKWSHIYLHYRYFINNQKLRPKQLQLLHLPKIQSQPIYFQPFTSQKEIFNSLLMYNQNSFCIRANYQLGNLIIKQVSQRFENITGYSRQKIMNCSINILMNQEVKKEHGFKFNLWLQKGVISNEDYYKVKKTEIVTIENEILPVYKYFKCFFGIQTGLDFFCMIKINLKSSHKNIYRNQTSKSLSDPKLQLLGWNKKKNFRQKNNIQNIFAKEEVFEPKKQSSESSCFKIISRLFLATMVLSIVITSILTKNKNNNLTNFSNQFISFMAVYRFPVILSTNYMKSIAKVGNQTKVNQQIQGATNNFIASSRYTQIKTTLFDQYLNPAKIYYPYYNYSFLENDSLTQIDLFYTIGSSISSLNKLPLNRTSPQYQRFTSYLKPSYDNMMNTTKYRLHQSFSTIFNKNILIQIVTIIVELTGFIIFIIFLIRLASNLTKRMDNVLLIITQFGHEQVNQSYTYWKFLHYQFNQLFSQSQSKTSNMITAETVNRQSSFKVEQIKVQINNSSKKIKQDAQNNICIFKIKVLILICSFLVFTTSISMQVRNILGLNSLYEFQQGGFYFLRFFPVGPLLTMGCMQKYYSDVYPEEVKFRPQKYDDVISAIFLFGSNDYFGENDLYSNYQKKRRNYFFGNPCQYNPSVLNPTGINIAKCESICNGTFKQGLSTFLRYAYRLGQDCIRNKVNLTAAQLDQFTLGGTVLSAFVLDSINTWLLQFIQRISSNTQESQIQAIIVTILIILIHFCINQAKIIKYLEGEYQLTKKAYNGLVPQALLINQKVVRQKFIIEGIISS